MHPAGPALAAVWLPMTVTGVASRFVRMRLPDRWHALRPWERDGRCYELVGIRVAKAVLRRGPLAVFNPGLHLPSRPTPERLARLDAAMRQAEASHTFVLVGTLAVPAVAALRGRRDVAGWALLLDVLVNGYPVMLQRYNRAFLARRFGAEGEAGRP